MTGKKLFLLAALTAAAMPIISVFLVFGTTGKADQILSGLFFAPFHIILTTPPFLIAAFLWPEMKRKKLAAAVALLITLIPWGWLTYGGWMTQSGHNMGGADIGTGMILFLLPFVLTPLVRIIGGPSKLNNPS